MSCKLAGIGHGDDESGFARFQRNEVVAEHQLGRDAAEQFRIDALLAQIDERAAIALGEALGLFALSRVVASAQNRADYWW